jgi:hypothetical protein
MPRPDLPKDFVWRRMLKASAHQDAKRTHVETMRAAE